MEKVMQKMSNMPKLDFRETESGTFELRLMTECSYMDAVSFADMYRGKMENDGCEVEEIRFVHHGDEQFGLSFKYSKK